MFDYVMNPIICVIWCSKATVDLHILPFIPVQAWFVSYAVLFTGLNLRGIEASASRVLKSSAPPSARARR